MTSRSLLLSSFIATLLVASAVDAKTPASTWGVTGTPGASGVEGTPTLTIEVPIGGISTVALCGDFAAPPNPANTVLNVNLGAGAVITGVGAAGSFTAISPSWLSEARVHFRGSVTAEEVRLSFSADNNPGTVNFDFPPIDLTGAGLPNIQTGGSGNLSLEFCETFDDPGTDGTFGAGSILRIACFNCTDPNAVQPLPAPTLNFWGLLALIGLFAGVGGLMARRFS